MNLIKTINTQALNALIDPIAKATGIIFWLRSLDYQQQLYVSPNYEMIWHRPTLQLYQHPESWMDTLVSEDRESLAQSFKQRELSHQHQLDPIDLAKDSLLFRVQRPDGHLSYVRDRAFLLTDKEGHPALIAGIGQPLQESEWCEAKQARVSITDQHTLGLEHALFVLLNQVLQLKPMQESLISNLETASSPYTILYKNRCLKLSLREAQCLYYSLQGHSAKQIAHYLNLSPRTVETYLEHIKNKAGCRTKCQLLSYVDTDLVEEWAKQLPHGVYKHSSSE